MKRINRIAASRRIACSTMDNASLKEVADLISEKVGSRANIAPAYIVNLGDGTGGVIYEDNSGYINLVGTDSQSSAFEYKDVITTVLESWGKDVSDYKD